MNKANKIYLERLRKNDFVDRHKPQYPTIEEINFRRDKLFKELKSLFPFPNATIEFNLMALGYIKTKNILDYL